MKKKMINGRGLYRNAERIKFMRERKKMWGALEESSDLTPHDLNGIWGS
jgi:hypothetical protein